jgi:hypothetical protein
MRCCARDFNKSVPEDKHMHEIFLRIIGLRRVA